MPQSTICSVRTCNRDTYARGYCRAHYDRLKTHGDVRAHIPLRQLPQRDERADIVGRILQKCTLDESGCITWHGYTMPSGYGTISWSSREWVVHRAMWTATVESIPTDDDWTLDHLCRNRACVNPDHLEVVTRIENSLRGGGLEVARVVNSTKTHCVHGHEYSDENTGREGGSGRRWCRACKRAAWARGSEAMSAKRRAAYAQAKTQGVDVTPTPSNSTPTPSA